MEKEEEKQNNPIDESLRSIIDEDHISKLPCDILAQILSIYPLDSGSKAVAAFTGLWNKPASSRTVDVQDFESVISDFYVSFDENNPLKNPRKLEFCFNKGLIVMASVGMKKKLNLDFSKGNQDLPRQFGWEVVLNTMDFPQSLPYPFAVKTLKLTSVDYSSCELISSLIKKFRYVETLIIENCSGLRSLRVEGLAKLTNLSVRDCFDLKSVFVDTLELVSLRHNGFLCWFSFENLMYFEDVMLDFVGPGFNNLDHSLYESLLRAIRDVEVLTLHGWMHKEVFGPLLFSKQYEQHFRFSKLKDLWWIDDCMEDDHVNSLFCFLRFCPNLQRLFITIDSRSYSKSSVSHHQSSGKVQKWRLRKLKVVKLEGFKKEEDVMSFNERLMEVFNAEPRVVDVRKGMHTRCLIRIPKRQAIGKSKDSNNIKFWYKFVEEVESLKHPHMP